MIFSKKYISSANNDILQNQEVSGHFSYMVHIQCLAKNPLFVWSAHLLLLAVARLLQPHFSKTNVFTIYGGDSREDNAGDNQTMRVFLSIEDRKL